MMMQFSEQGEKALQENIEYIAKTHKNGDYKIIDDNIIITIPRWPPSPLDALSVHTFEKVSIPIKNLDDFKKQNTLDLISVSEKSFRIKHLRKVIYLYEEVNKNGRQEELDSGRNQETGSASQSTQSEEG